MTSVPSLLGSVHHKPLGQASVRTSALLGLQPHPVTVEVSCTRGPPSFRMVGLPEAPVREARVRIGSALACLGVLLDEYAIVVNLAPADLPKSGATLDLALAVAVLTALGKLPQSSLDALLILGELSLDGSLQPLRGVLPHLFGAFAKAEPGSGIREAVVPSQHAAEAGLVGAGKVRLAHHLRSLVEHLRGGAPLPVAEPTPFRPAHGESTVGDLEQVLGQPMARRALEVAAAGGHNLLLVGPPGAGKTLLARLMPTILPPLRFEEAIETTSIHSVSGLLSRSRGVVDSRPFRAPHHSVTTAGLVGGGSPLRPGEVSLAHHGVLFLDEFAEFRRGTLESLRQPLEDGCVSLSRSRCSAWFPAKPLVVAAMNPCPCGFRGESNSPRSCRCSPAQIARYQSKLSGPLLDRLDVHVRVPPVDVRTLSSGGKSESSASVRGRVLAARELQLHRLTEGLTSRPTNAELPLNELEHVARLDTDSRRLLEAAANQLGLSARAFVKVLRVARTAADLEGAEKVSSPHVAEAIQGRLLDAR